MAVAQWMRVGIENSAKKRTIPVLDGVRAFACLIVVWFHIYRIPRDLSIWPTQPFVYKVLNTLLAFGEYGVTLFFVLSGFLLFLPFAKALMFEEQWPSIRQFYLRRFFRIVPAYYLSLILIVLLFQRQYLEPQHWKELGLFFLFFMDSTQETFKQLNAPFWTLAIEWQFYMLLPLLVIGMRWLVGKTNRHMRVAMTVGCVLLVIGWGLFSRYYGTYFQQNPTATFIVPRPVLNVFLFFTYGTSGKYFEDFGVGMLLALFFAYVYHPGRSPKLGAILRRISPWCGLLGLSCLWMVAMWSYNQQFANTWPLFNGTFFTDDVWLMSELVVSLSFGLCIFALLFGVSFIRRPLEWYPMRWVGTVSFSLYMWHLPLLFLFIQWGQPLLSGWSPEQSYIMYWLWVLVIILPYSLLFFKWVEKPGAKLGQRLMSAAKERKSGADADRASTRESERSGEQEKVRAGKVEVKVEGVNARVPQEVGR
jgi:peptidoglycan/LPS O-acetylase OafA/YrhL